MEAFCTYCSAQKNPSLKLVPAITRYQSKRIISVYEKSRQQKCEFFILSGKFGLLNPIDKVPMYDHLLQQSELEALSEIVADQIKVLGISKIDFFTRSQVEDKNVLSYTDCMRKACDITNTILIIRNYRDLLST